MPRFRSVVVITFASHAKGPRFETGRKQLPFTTTAPHLLSFKMQKEPRPESHRHLKAFSALDHQAWPLCVCSQSPWRAGHTQLVTPTRARRTRPTAGYLYFHASADLLIWRLRLPDGLTATVALKSSTFFPGRHTCATGVFICLTKAKNTNQLHLGPGPKTRR